MFAMLSRSLFVGHLRKLNQDWTWKKKLARTKCLKNTQQFKNCHLYLLASPYRAARRALSCDDFCHWFSSSTLLFTWREIKLLCACHVLCWPKNLWHLNKAFCKVGWLLGMSSFHSEISSNNSLLLLLHDAQWLKWSGKVGMLF